MSTVSRRLGVTFILASLTSLVACTGVPASQPTSTSTPVAASAKARPEGMPDVITDGVLPDMKLGYNEWLEVPFSYSEYPQFEAMPEANRVFEDAVRQTTEKFATEHKGDKAASLGIAWHPTSHDVRFTGLMMAVSTVSGERLGARYATYVLDRTRKAAVASREMILPAQREALEAGIKNSLTNPAGVKTESLLDSLNRSRDGNLVAVVSDSTKPVAESVVEVTVAKDAALPLLTEEGKQWLTASQVALPMPSFQPVEGEPNDAAEPSEASEPSEPTDAAGPPGNAADVDCAALKCVALTFDDGPSKYTPQLLDDLKAAKAPSTFFVIGRNAQSSPDLLKRMVAEGHVVGNHTWTHPDLARLDDATVLSEFKRTSAAIRASAGYSPTLMRPPYGSYVKGKTPSGGMSIILWNVDTEDWRNRNVAITTQKAVSAATPGSIILMHDIHPTTIQAVPGIIRELKAKGFTLVTVPQLLGKTKPGVSYSQR